ncbi:TetR/AcrR family transcriptional regulator [Dyadobacter sp. CY343]|uniref:TetR/AcrR family transcriptional regulator n=1 Tax=Dyadobacter sp. CY343 TaxID=2907299 RepID=UPI001F24D45D|nr:TetR/AcrR family transcriptional regulator [Dyadobacter sp. CY343]MCE7059481.1 TetR/AcrR family transcriptional regulator [Dyadobacter sp. CY343]
MAGRPKIYDESEALDQAVKVFWERGYSNASADELLKAMGIGKGSFYLAFKGGKQELFEKTMKRVVDQNFREFRNAVATCDNPVQLVRDFFMSLAGAESPIGNKGCYFGNALVQISGQDSGLKIMAAENLQLLETIFEEAMQRGKQMGLLRTAISPQMLAAYLINLWNGFNLTRRMEDNPEKLLNLIRLNLEIIE